MVVKSIDETATTTPTPGGEEPVDTPSPFDPSSSALSDALAGVTRIGGGGGKEGRGEGREEERDRDGEIIQMKQK